MYYGRLKVKEEMSEKRLKVLMVLPTFDVCGGVESYVLNYMRRLKNEIHFDIIAHGEGAAAYVDEVKSMGAEVTLLPHSLLGNPAGMKRELDSYFASHSYDVVHCNMPNGAWYYLGAAERAGIKTRIMHAHQTKYADKLTHSLRNIPLIKLGLKKATAYMACSKLAGDFLFGKKQYDLIKNAIDMDRFIADYDSREQLKDKMGLSGKKVIIHTGRFCNQKNQPFALEVFKRVKNRLDDAQLVFLGDGEQKQAAEKMALEMELGESVLFPGTVENTEEWLRASDAFILPSLYEGLPLSALEAQAAGLPCVIADTVTRELNITGNVSFLPLTYSYDEWAEVVIGSLTREKMSAGKIRECFAQAGYDIEKEASHLLDVYSRLTAGK